MRVAPLAVVEPLDVVKDVRPSFQPQRTSDPQGIAAADAQDVRRQLPIITAMTQYEIAFMPYLGLAGESEVAVGGARVVNIDRHPTLVPSGNREKVRQLWIMRLLGCDPTAFATSPPTPPRRHQPALRCLSMTRFGWPKTRRPFPKRGPSPRPQRESGRLTRSRRCVL